MIYKNKKLILEVQENLTKFVNKVEQQTLRKIETIHKGSKQVWKTIYNVIRSCFGKGTWFSDKPWLGDDRWSNN